MVFLEGLTEGGTARAGGPLESNWRTKEGCWSVRRNCRNLGGQGEKRQYLNGWLEGKLGIWGLTLKCQGSLGPEKEQCFAQQSLLFSAHSPLYTLC